MSDFILDYDILESIAKYSNSIGKRSEEYSESLENKIISAIGSVTGPSSGYLTSASDSVRDKINALKQKSEAFYQFAKQIENLLEVAERIDQEVADAIAAGREYFLDHHESLRIDDWKAKLLSLYVDLKNSIPLLGTIADMLEGLDTIFESLKDSVRHWYECEGGKYILEAVGSVVVAAAAVALFVLAFPVSGFAAVCGAIGAGIMAINAVTNVATSFRAVDAALDGNPAWAVIYGKQDKLSDVLRQTNFGSGTWNDISNLGAGAIDATETFCDIVGLAGMGAGIAKMFKGDALKLLKNKGSFNLSGLKNSVKNGIVDLKTGIKQGYANFKNGSKLDDIGEIGKDLDIGKGGQYSNNQYCLSGEEHYKSLKEMFGTENVEWTSRDTLGSADRLRIQKWEYPPTDDLYLKYKDVYQNELYYNQVTGDIRWPINNGFAEYPDSITLKSGTIIDRYGSDYGTFTSPVGISYESRALAPGTDLKPYSILEVVESIDVQSGKIAPWFNQPGGGVQYLLPDTVDELIDAGIIRRIQ